MTSWDVTCLGVLVGVAAAVSLDGEQRGLSPFSSQKQVVCLK